MIHGLEIPSILLNKTNRKNRLVSMTLMAVSISKKTRDLNLTRDLSLSRQ